MVPGERVFRLLELVSLGPELPTLLLDAPAVSRIRLYAVHVDCIQREESDLSSGP